MIKWIKDSLFGKHKSDYEDGSRVLPKLDSSSFPPMPEVKPPKVSNILETKEVFDSNTYPEDGEYVIYYFEPFKMWNVGEFHRDRCGESMVFGKSGFTSWHPEVTKWMKGE